MKKNKLSLNNIWKGKRSTMFGLIYIGAIVTGVATGKLSETALIAALPGVYPLLTDDTDKIKKDDISEEN